MKKHLRNILSVLIVLSAFACVCTVVGLRTPVNASASPYKEVEYADYSHNSKFNGTTIVNGVDVSEYQPNINWNTAKNNGVQFAILRTSFTGYGSAGNKVADKSFSSHYRGAKAAGIPVGVYVFSQATSVAEAVAEANYAISILQANGIGPDDLDLPVYMDYEYAGASDGGRMVVFKNKNKNSYNAVFTACADAFCSTVANAGYTPGIYASTSFMQGSGCAINGTSLGTNANMWAAQYYNQCQYKSTYNMWQYSSSAKISGIYGSSGNKSRVDVNFWYVNDPSIIGVKLDNIGIVNLKKTTVAEPQAEESIEAKEQSEEKTEGETVENQNKEDAENANEIAKTEAVGAGLANTDAANTEPSQAESSTNEGGSDVASEEQKTEDAATENTENIEQTENAELNAENAELAEETVEYLVKLNEQATAIGYSMDEYNIYGIVPGSTIAGLKNAIQLDESLVGYTLQVVNAKTRWVYSDNTAVSTGKMLNILDASGNRVGSLNLVVNGSANVYATESFTYDGGVKTSGVVAVINGVTVANGYDVNNNYVVLYYPGGRALPGVYTITVSGVGILQGTNYYASYGIYLNNTYIKSLSRKSKGFKVKWAKLSKSNAKGYQIQYSLNANMTSAKTKTYNSYKTKTATIKKLKKKRYYYVRIRTFRKIGGTKYYSPWSEARAVKTK